MCVRIAYTGNCFPVQTVVLLLYTMYRHLSTNIILFVFIVKQTFIVPRNKLDFCRYPFTCSVVRFIFFILVQMAFRGFLIFSLKLKSVFTSVNDILRSKTFEFVNIAPNLTFVRWLDANRIYLKKNKNTPTYSPLICHSYRTSYFL